MTKLGEYLNRARKAVARFTDWDRDTVKIVSESPGTSGSQADRPTPKGRASQKPNAEEKPKGQPRQMLWRLAFVTNPKTGKQAVVQCNRDGSLAPSDAKRFGTDNVAEWTEVRATSQKEARLAIERGRDQAYEVAPMEGDQDINELLPEMERLLNQGAFVFLKWSCPGCGERVTADEPNAYCALGYRHTERKDGSPCGAVYVGKSFGYMVLWAPWDRLDLNAER